MRSPFLEIFVILFRESNYSDREYVLQLYGFEPLSLTCSVIYCLPPVSLFEKWDYSTLLNRIVK